MSRQRKLTQSQTDEMIRLRASGVDSRAISRVFDVSKTTVLNYLKSQDAKDKLLLLRESIKHIVMQRTASELMDGAAGVAAEMIKQTDAKGLDAATRAIMNLEKASSSASGENKKIEISGEAGQPITVDVRALIGQIVAHHADTTGV